MNVMEQSEHRLAMSISTHFLIAFLGTTTLAIVVILLTLVLRHRLHQSIISPRKFMHIVVGPVFLLCIAIWPNARYKQQHNEYAAWSAYLAGLIPGLSGILFWLIGSGQLLTLVGRKTIMPLVDAVSRTGSLAELRRGPAMYGIVIGLCTMFCFTYSPILVILVSCLSIGDGLAEATARFGEKCSITTKLPWNSDKSVAGSLGFLVSSVISSMLLGAYFIYQECWDPSLLFSHYWRGAIVSCFVSMLVETLPIREFDNLTVSLTAITISYLWFSLGS